EIHGTYDPETKSGSGFTVRKVKGPVHWVDANNCVPCEFRLFEPLILDNDPENEGKHFLDQINPNSLEVLQGYVEPTQIKDAKPLDKFQFVRNGFYSVDTKYTTDDKLVFNRIVPLKSSFKLESK
ncbi:MAG: glutamine--tRNA ligase, partial [Faecalibacillus sp.]